MRTKKKTQQGIWGAISFAAVAVGFAPTAAFAVPELKASRKFSFQGVVSGIPDGDYPMKVEIQGGISNHFVEFGTGREVPVRGGVFTLVMDESDGLLPAHFFKEDGTSFNFNLHVNHDGQPGYDSVFSGIPVTAVPVAFVAHESLDAKRLQGLEASWPEQPTAGAFTNTGLNGKVVKVVNGKLALEDDLAGLPSVPTASTSEVGGFQLPGTPSSHSFLNSDGTFKLLPAVDGTQAGLVPAHTGNDQNKYFAGDGQWRSLPAGFTLQTAGPTQLGGVQIPASASALFMASNDLKVKVKASNPLIINGSNELEFSSPADTSKWMRGDGTWQPLPTYSLPIAGGSLGGVKSNAAKSVAIDGAGELDVKLATTSGLQKDGSGNLSVKVKASNPLILNGSNELEVSVGTGSGTVAAGNDARFGAVVPAGTVITSVLATAPSGYLAMGSVQDRTAQSGLYAALGPSSKILRTSNTSAVPGHDEFLGVGATDAALVRVYETSGGGAWKYQRSTNAGSSWSAELTFPGWPNQILATPPSPGPDIWVAAVGSDVVVSSDGGVSWGSTVTGPGGTSNVAWTGSTFLLAGASQMYATNDPASGTWGSPITGLGGSVDGMATDGVGDNVYFASGQVIKKSADLAPGTGTFTTVYDAGSGNYLYGGIAYSGSKFCAATTPSYGSKIVTSPTGATWTQKTWPAFWDSSASFYKLYGFNANGGTFALLLGGGTTGAHWWKLYTSSDCESWTLRHEMTGQNDTISSTFYHWKVAASASHFYLFNIQSGETIKVHEDGVNFQLPLINATDGLFRYIKY